MKIKFVFKTESIKMTGPQWAGAIIWITLAVCLIGGVGWAVGWW